MRRIRLQKKYDIVYLDPPWDYKGQLQHSKPGTGDTGGAARHYGTLKLSRLKQFPIQTILADDALVFMWVTNPHLDQGIELIKSWGLKYATVAFVWDKTKVNPGFYTMSQCELCIVAKKGKIPRPRGARNIRQLVTHPREQHSKKPDDVRHRIEAMFPEQTKVELFAREKSEGWDCWGNETDSTVELRDHLATMGWEI
jgi:N6-adenosine-specific RNA methylase IME4